MGLLRLGALSLALLLTAATKAATQPFLIGAWYFGLWTNNEPSRQLRNAERFYGRHDIWAGIKDCAEADCSMPGLRPDKDDLSSFHSRKPQIGYYNVTDPSVVSLHMQQAGSAGLGFFTVYWYVDAMPTMIPHGQCSRQDR
jgi:hypothetical protein